MGKAPLILQYLHDHARLICDRRNEKDGPGKWKIAPITDDQRHNIIFHYGTAENFQDNKVPQPEKIVESPTLNCCEINLKGLERREMIRMTEKKITRQSNRITLKRGPRQNETKIKTGIFCNGIQANREMPTYHQSELPVRNPSPSTSSIYLASLPVSISDASDYEKDLFRTPEDLNLAQFHHQCDLERCEEGFDDGWLENTVNFTQSQQQSGFIPRHQDYYHFNSQK